MHTLSRIILLAALSAAIAGCATTAPTIPSTMIVPPDKPIVARYRRVAVLPFEGVSGKSAADYLGGRLRGTRFNGGTVFTVADYGDLRSSAGEYYDLVMEPPVNTGKLQEIGRMLGVKGLYVGSVSHARADDTQKRERSTQSERKIVTRCAGVEASFKAEVRLIDVASGAEVYEETLSGDAGEEDCSDQDVTGMPARKILVADVAHILLSGGTDARKDAAFSAALDKAFTPLLDDIVPHAVALGIPLLGPEEDSTPAGLRVKMERGISAAREGNMDRACRLWSEARTMKEDSPEVLHDLGVCREVKGDLEGAKILYQRSLELSQGRNELGLRALERIKNRVENQDRIVQLGYTPK